MTESKEQDEKQGKKENRRRTIPVRVLQSSQLFVTALHFRFFLSFPSLPFSSFQFLSFLSQSPLLLWQLHAGFRWGLSFLFFPYLWFSGFPAFVSHPIVLGRKANWRNRKERKEKKRGSRRKGEKDWRRKGSDRDLLEPWNQGMRDEAVLLYAALFILATSHQQKLTENSEKHPTSTLSYCRQSLWRCWWKLAIASFWWSLLHCARIIICLCCSRRGSQWLSFSHHRTCLWKTLNAIRPREKKEPMEHVSPSQQEGCLWDKDPTNDLKQKWNGKKTEERKQHMNDVEKKWNTECNRKVRALPPLHFVLCLPSSTSSSFWSSLSQSYVRRGVTFWRAWSRPRWCSTHESNSDPAQKDIKDRSTIRHRDKDSTHQCRQTEMMQFTDRQC